MKMKIFKTLKEWQARRKEILKTLRRLLGIDAFGPRKKVQPKIEPYKSRLEKWQEEIIEKNHIDIHLHRPSARDKFISRRYTYPGADGKEASAIVRFPKNLKGRVPAILTPHGHLRGLQIGKEGTDHIAVPLAEAGFITFSPDAIPSGERRMEELDRIENAQNGMAFWGERLLVSEYFPQGKTILGAQMWDLMRAIDILQSISEVDKNKIGAIGGSQGGIHSLWIAALDNRVKASFCGSGAYLYRTLAGDFNAQALFTAIPGILKHTDMEEVTSLIAPRSFVAYIGKKDPTFTPADIIQIECFAKKIYRLYGAEKNFSKVIHDGEHCDEFAYPDWDKYIKWFREAFSKKYYGG